MQAKVDIKKSMVLVLTVAALAAPAAQADPWQFEQAPTGIITDASDRQKPAGDAPASAAHMTDSSDRLVVRLDPGLANALREARAARAEREYLIEHLVDPARANALRDVRSSAPRTHAEAEGVAPPRKVTPIASASDGFAWAAAGIGASIAFSLVLLFVSGFGLVRHRQPSGA
jgi:hypothetical protein